MTLKSKIKKGTSCALQNNFQIAFCKRYKPSQLKTPAYKRGLVSILYYFVR